MFSFFPALFSQASSATDAAAPVITAPVIAPTVTPAPVVTAPRMPSEWRCPITHDIMTDPVIGSDGITYEREAITQWLRANNTSPVTRSPMLLGSLIPNIALRNLIQASTSTTTATATSSSETSVAGAGAVTTPAPFVNAELTSISTSVVYDGRRYGIETLSPPVTGARQPITLLAILDNSGSMGEVADSTAAESHGFTRLDLVKHAMRTIIGVLEPTDSLGIVSFSTTAKKVFPVRKMTAANKTAAEDAVASIFPDSQTNIFDGIAKAAELVTGPEFAGENIVAMLLTDGYPNVAPGRGTLESLQNEHLLKVTHPWTVHTFGFGYALDSTLLGGIASWGHGMFGFIPDCTMAGTVFINFLATVLSTAARTSHGLYQYGQPRDSVVVSETTESATTLHLPAAAFRHAFIGTIGAAIDLCRVGYFGDGEALLTVFAERHAANPDPVVKAILRDIRSPTESEGQIGMSPRFFSRWGEHYMRAYKRAQELQICMNFKDPGLQMYGGEAFREVQKLAEKVFCELPPPVPSGTSAFRRSSGSGGGGGGGGGGVAAALSPLISMASYYTPIGGGCFHPDSRIRMADGNETPIQALRAGQEVATPNGPAKIRAVVECNSFHNQQPLSNIGSLWITPWHPVRISGEWKFPADIVGVSNHRMYNVFNLVLEQHHSIYAEGIEAITLGHGLREPVIAHEFFGTDAVIRALQRLPGWNEGRPMFENLVALRDPDTGMVYDWIDYP